MPLLTRSDLWSLEQYSEQRENFRLEVLAHKKNRQLALGDNARIYFEDTLTIRYQIQEMLRIEKVFEVAGIEEELAAYNPLIPDGTNWKATFMIEYGDVEERQRALANMGGIEETVWVQVGDGTKAYAIANEDMERTRDSKAAAVHFMRFELSGQDLAELRQGAAVHMGLDHASLANSVTLEATVRAALCKDLDL